MRYTIAARVAFAACALQLVADAADAGPTTAAQVVAALNGQGFSDGPVTFTASSGTDSVSITGNNISELYNKYNALYPPGTEQLRTIAASNFADVFAANIGQFQAGIRPQLFTNFPLLNTVPVFSSLDFAGVSVQLSFPANANTLTLDVVGTNIHQTFTGATRYDFITQLETYVTDNQNQLINDIHNAVASNTTSDPVIGNPESLVGSIASLTAMFGTTAGETDGPNARQNLDPVFMVSMEPQYFSTDGTSGEAVRVPLSYSWFDKDDPRYAFTLDMPLSYFHERGADSYSGALGIGYRVPLARHWYLTPQAHIGLVASISTVPGGIDYGAALFSFAARSEYNIYLDDNRLKIALIDTGGFYHSIQVDIGKVSLDPKVESGVFTNGLNAETGSGYTLYGNRTTWQAYFLDTQVVGTHSRINSWDEVGASFGTPDDLTAQAWENFRIGSSFAFARAGYRAYELNLTERF